MSERGQRDLLADLLPPEVVRAIPSDGGAEMVIAARYIHRLIGELYRLDRRTALSSERETEPCRIYEHDGSYMCHTHNRLWGAVTDPDEPCDRGDPPEEGREPDREEVLKRLYWSMGYARAAEEYDEGIGGIKTPTGYMKEGREIYRRGIFPVPPEREQEPNVVSLVLALNYEDLPEHISESLTEPEFLAIQEQAVTRRHPPREPEGELTWLPTHKAGLHLTHNEHRCYYQSVEQFGKDGPADWVSDEERERAIAADEVWCLQWYPETPVGFNAIAASSLEALREALRPAPDSEEG